MLLQVRENEVESARDDVEVQRQAAAEHLVTMAKLTTEARAAKESVHSLVVKRRDARVAAIAARQQDRRELREAKQRENHIKQLILAAARRATGGYSGPTTGSSSRR